MYGSNANIVASGSISRFRRGWANLLGLVDSVGERRFYWGGSTSVSTASALEITLNSKILWAVSQVSHTRSGTGRHGGHPSQMPEANIAAVPDDTEVIPPKCPEANIAAVPDDTEVIPPKCQKRTSHRYRTTRRSSLPRAESEYRSERVDLAISSHCMILASIRTPSCYQVYSTV